MQNIIIIGKKDRLLLDFYNSVRNHAKKVVTTSNGNQAKKLITSGEYGVIFCDQYAFKDFDKLPLKSLIIQQAISGKKLFVIQRTREIPAEIKQVKEVEEIIQLPLSEEKIKKLTGKTGNKKNPAATKSSEELAHHSLIADFDTNDYLQLLAMNKTTKAFSVEGNKGRGIIVVKDGELIFASYGDLKGELAFHAINSIKDGKIIDQKIKKIPPPNIHKPLDKLLLETSLKKDELNEESTDIDEEDFIQTEETISVTPPSSNEIAEKQPPYKKAFFMGAVAIIALLMGIGSFLLTGSSKDESTEIAATSKTNDSQANRATASSSITIEDVQIDNTVEEGSKKNNQVFINNHKLDVLFRLHGSNTIGSALAPEMASAFLQEELNGKNIDILQGKEEGEKYVIADINTDGGEKRVAVEVSAHGTVDGFKNLQKNLCDITMASRKINKSEVRLLSRLGNMTDREAEHILALDGVAVIVNKSNPLDSLSIEEIADIYKGKITDWAEVGDGKKKGKINRYTLSNTTGTHDIFKSIIMRNSPIDKKAKVCKSNSDISDYIAEDKDGIGFTGLPYINQTKALLINYKDTVPIAPTFFTVATEDYPLTRRLYLYQPVNSKNKDARKFIDFALSASGQAIVKDIGFVDLNPKTFSYNIDVEDYKIYDKSVVENYLENIKGKKRISLSFRFLPGTYKLDNRSLKDIERIVNFLKGRDFKEIILFGFTDSEGDYYYNMGLSLKRAKAVRNELKSRGIFVDKVIGMSEELPIAPNDTREGKEKNRRVTIWIAE